MNIDKNGRVNITDCWEKTMEQNLDEENFTDREKATNQNQLTRTDNEPALQMLTFKEGSVLCT